MITLSRNQTDWSSFGLPANSIIQRYIGLNLKFRKHREEILNKSSFEAFGLEDVLCTVWKVDEQKLEIDVNLWTFHRLLLIIYQSLRY